LAALDVNVDLTRWMAVYTFPDLRGEHEALYDEFIVFEQYFAVNVRRVLMTGVRSFAGGGYRARQDAQQQSKIEHAPVHDITLL